MTPKQVCKKMNQSARSDKLAAVLIFLMLRIRGSLLRSDPTSISREFILQLMACHVKECIPFLAEDCTFAGPFAAATGSGKSAIVDFCIKAQPLLAQLEFAIDSNASIYRDTHTCVTLVCARVLRQDKPDINGRATLVWRLTARGPKLVHLHISAPVLEHTSEGIREFFVKDSRNMHPASLLPEEKPLILKDSDNVTHVVVPRSVLYLEAQHQYVCVCQRTERFRIRNSLTDLLSRFPGYFVRVHRSYAVNVLYVSKVSREEIQLGDFEKVPIPLKQSAQIREKVLSVLNDTLAAAHAESQDATSTLSQGAPPPRTYFRLRRCLWVKQMCDLDPIFRTTDSESRNGSILPGSGPRSERGSIYDRWQVHEGRARLSHPAGCGGRGQDGIVRLLGAAQGRMHEALP